MPRKSNVTVMQRKAPETKHEDTTLDEACFLAALRRSVEGAPTPAEDRLAKANSDWDGRLGRIVARLAR